jgi:hypothetical protein
VRLPHRRRSSTRPIGRGAAAHRAKQHFAGHSPLCPFQAEAKARRRTRRRSRLVRRERPQHLGGDDRIDAEVGARSVAGPARSRQDWRRLRFGRSVGCGRSPGALSTTAVAECRTASRVNIRPPWPDELAPDPAVMSPCRQGARVSTGMSARGRAVAALGVSQECVRRFAAWDAACTTVR